MKLKNKRFLVIGGAGFIGSHVVDELLKEGVKEVIVYDNFSRGRVENLREALNDPRCKIFELGGDILYRDILDKAMEGVDGIFHLAAMWLLHCYDYPETAFEVNIRGTFNVIQAAVKNKVKRVVYSSSASVYGNALTLPMSEDHPYNNETFYGATKIAGEHMFKSLGIRYKLPWVGLRYMNVYGPRQDYQGTYVAVMHKIIDKLDKGEKPVLYGDGSQQYDFVYVGDVARANICAMKADVTGECYNVGRGIGTSLKDLTEMIIKHSGKKSTIQYEQSGLTFVTNRIGSIEKAKKEIGFKSGVSLEVGLRELINWRRKHVLELQHIKEKEST